MGDVDERVRGGSGRSHGFEEVVGGVENGGERGEGGVGQSSNGKGSVQDSGENVGRRSRGD